jgi:hypothetical protein
VAFRIQKLDRVIAALNKKNLSRNHKFVILVPTTYAEALDLDKHSGTGHWQEAIYLEANNVDVAFQDMEDGEQMPVGYQFLKFHMILNVKAGSLKCKARYATGGHMTEAPSAITYSNLFSRESIRIGLLIAELND